MSAVSKEIFVSWSQEEREMEETELAQRLHEHLWFAYQYWQTFPNVCVCVAMLAVSLALAHGAEWSTCLRK